MRHVMLTSLAVLCAASCAIDERRQDGSRFSGHAEEIVFQDEHGTIVAIRSRDHLVRIDSSPVGPLFSLTSTEGETIAAEMTLVELQDRFPQIYQSYRSSVANGSLLYAGNQSASSGSVEPTPQVQLQGADADR